jgi:hypothetical protein
LPRQDPRLRRQIDYQLTALINNLFELGAEHIYASVIVKIATERNVKPVALLAFNCEFV